MEGNLFSSIYSHSALWLDERQQTKSIAVTKHKMVEIEDRSEFCISKIIQVDEETIAEMTNTSQQQINSIKQHGRHLLWYGSFNILKMKVSKLL